MVRNNVVVFYSMFTLSAPFAIRCRFSISHDAFHSFPYLLIFPMFPTIQGSLFTVRCAVRHSLFAEPFAIRRAIRCHFSMSPDAFHRKQSVDIEK